MVGRVMMKSWSPKFQEDSDKLLLILLHGTLQETPQFAHICGVHLTKQEMIFKGCHKNTWSSYLTNSTGNDPSISWNSFLASSVDINVDKWKSLTLTGISVNFPKILRISGLDFSEVTEISIGVSFFSSQTAVGSTLREKHHRMENTIPKISPKFQQILNKI